MGENGEPSNFGEAVGMKMWKNMHNSRPFDRSRPIGLARVGVFVSLFVVCAVSGTNAASRATVERLERQGNLREALYETKVYLVENPGTDWATGKEAELTKKLLQEARLRSDTASVMEREQRLTRLKSLIGLYIDRDRPEDARRLLDDLRQVAPNDPAITRLAKQLGGAAAPAQPDAAGNSAEPIEQAGSEGVGQLPRSNPSDVVRDVGIVGGVVVFVALVFFVLFRSKREDTGSLGNIEAQKLSSRRVNSAAQPGMYKAMEEDSGIREMDQQLIDSEGDMSGKLQQINIINFVQYVHSEGKTGVLRISGDRGVGKVFFIDGDIDSAFMDERSGVDALYHILEWKTGVFEFHTQNVRRTDQITLPVPHLMLQFVTQQDETERDNAGNPHNDPDGHQGKQLL